MPRRSVVPRLGGQSAIWLVQWPCCSRYASTTSLTWNDNSDNEVGFHIRRRVDGIAYAINDRGRGCHELPNSGLDPSTECFYRVAPNSSGTADWSAEASVEPGRRITYRSRFGAQYNRSLRRRDRSTWSDNSGDEQGFHVERRGPGQAYVRVATVGVNVTSYQDTGLDAATEYFYQIIAFNAAGEALALLKPGLRLMRRPTSLSVLRSSPGRRFQIRRFR